MANTLRTTTFPGVPGGMCVAVPAYEIPDTHARYLQDALVYQAGSTIRRGPMQAVSGVASFATKKLSGLIQTTDPTGATKVAGLHGTAAAKLGVLSTDFTTETDIDWYGTFPTGPYTIVDAKACATGGILLGTSSQYDGAGITQALGLWKGAGKPTYTTGTVTVTRGSTAVVGGGTSWSANAQAGMFLFDNLGQLIGCAKSIDSNTTLTLERPALVAAAGVAYSLKPVRGINPRVTKGTFTVVAAATAVTGASTKFLDQGLGTGTWDIYRASDYTWVGQVASVASNTALTLSAGAAIAMTSDDYLAVRRDGDYSLQTNALNSRKVGFLNAVYAGVQWYANLNQTISGVACASRAWFADGTDFEALDLSVADGDFIDVVSGSGRGANTSLHAMVPAYNSLVFIKENETLVVLGSSPDTFSVAKITDDGTLSGMSAQPYDGGVVWAGRDGIYFYDGLQANNLTTDTLGEYYKACVRTFDPSVYRMWSMIEREHYFLFIERVTPPLPVIKGITSSTPTVFTFIVHLPSKAVVTATNLNIRGSVVLPASTGKGTWYATNSSADGFICNATTLFDTDGNDAFGCDAGTAGPDFYMESKRYTLGDSMLKKLFKQLAFQYLAAGAALKIDTVLGLNEVGATSSTVIPATVYTWDQLAAVFPNWAALAAAYPTWSSLVQGIYMPKRVKFLKRSQEMGFRLYQSSTSVTALRLGPWQIGWKPQRTGRI